MQPRIPYSDIVALRAIDNARRALERSPSFQGPDDPRIPNAHDQVCNAFLALARRHLDPDVARALMDALIGTGDDVEECLTSVTSAPTVYVEMVADPDGKHRPRRVFTCPDTAGRYLDDRNSALPEDEHAWLALAELVHNCEPDPADPDPYDHSAAKEDARAEAANDDDLSDWVAAREGVATALRRLYGPLNAESIINADAFGALVSRVTWQCLNLDGTPLSILQSVDAGDRDFAIHGADEPAAFLAAKVRDL